MKKKFEGKVGFIQIGGDNMITSQNFGTHNRSKTIGNSLYRICRVEYNKGQWYIHETYSDKDTWMGNNDYYSDDLQSAIDKFNKIAKEKEIVSLRFSC